MIRYSYLPVETSINDVNIYDLTKLNWNNFQFKRGIKKYRLTTQDVERFYDLMNREYENLSMEDWVYYVNKIDDPTSLRIGQEIILPNIQDIQDFLQSELGVQS